jgi:glutamate--cysteine ligase
MSIPQTAGGPIGGRDDLVAYLAAGTKPREEWRIGTEHEKFVYSLKSLKPLPYEAANPEDPSIRTLLKAEVRSRNLSRGHGPPRSAA